MSLLICKIYYSLTNTTQCLQIFFLLYLCLTFQLFSITASQAAARARGTAGQQSAAVSSITGMDLQEAQKILNLSTLTPEEIQKVTNKIQRNVKLGTRPCFVCVLYTMLYNLTLIKCFINLICTSTFLSVP